MWDDGRPQRKSRRLYAQGGQSNDLRERREELLRLSNENALRDISADGMAQNSRDIIRGLGWFVALLIGSGGVIWQYQNTRINTIKTIADLRDRELAIYRDVVALADSHARIYDENKTLSPDELKRRVAPIDEQSRMRISDYEALEKQLASLENRRPREIPLDFLKPGAPVGLKFIP